MNATARKLSPHEELDSVYIEGISGHSAWRDLESGMQVLHRYAGHSDCDAATIAKANLRLVHKILLANSNYHRQINAAVNRAHSISYLTKQALVTTAGLEAELVSVPNDCCLELTPQRGRYAMMLIIAGKAKLHRKTTTKTNTQMKEMSWWRFGKSSIENKKPLRNGDVVITLDSQSHVESMKPLGKNCVILSVSVTQ